MEATSSLNKPNEGIEKKSCALLVFRVAEQSFAFHVNSVDQMILMLRLTRPPHLNPFVQGIANIHGHAIPVMNARRLFGMPSQEPGMYTPIILVNIGDRRLGLTVDEVLDVIYVPEESIHSPETIFPGGMVNPMVASLVYQVDRSILVLDPLHLPQLSEVKPMLAPSKKNGNGKKSAGQDEPKLSSNHGSEHLPDAAAPALPAQKKHAAHAGKPQQGAAGLPGNGSGGE